MKHLAAISLALAVSASAHIKAGSLNVKSGTSWTVGQKVSLSWSASIDHNKSSYNLWYSVDSGKNWTSIKTGIPGAASNVAVTYEWTVPNQPTTKGIVRVFQTFGGTVSSNLSKPGDYTLFSPPFQIVPASAVAPSAAPIASLRQTGDRLEIGLPSARTARLEVLGLDGSLLRTIDLGAAAAGNGEASLPLAELGRDGVSVLRLVCDGVVAAQQLVGSPD